MQWFYGFRYYGFRQNQRKEGKDDEKKNPSNLAFLQALSCKFISNLIKRSYWSVYLYFGNLLKES